MIGSRIPNALNIIIMTIRIEISRDYAELSRCANESRDACLAMLKRGLSDKDYKKFTRLNLLQSCALQNMGDFEGALRVIEQYDAMMHDRTPSISVLKDKSLMNQVKSFCIAAGMASDAGEPSLDKLKEIQSIFEEDSKMNGQESPVIMGSLSLALFSLRKINSSYLTKAINAMESAFLIDNNQIERERSVLKKELISKKISKDWFSFVDVMSLTLNHEAELTKKAKPLLRR